MKSIKTKILDIMERSLECYSKERIIAYIKTVREEGLKEHGFPRLGANLAFLIAHGRKCEFQEYMLEILDVCVEQIPLVKAANEFSIKELILAILELENAGTVDKERIEFWKRGLAKETPFNLYKKLYTLPGRLSNWAVFAAASEWGRVAFWLGGDREFVDKQLDTQKEWFDENGCYLDPNNPIVYDMVTRSLLCYMLRFGYDGRYKDFLDKNLEKAGLYTLKTLSINGEIAFGGRSNQFVFNEALLVPVLFHEADRNYKRGNLVLAGQFKSAAVKCLDKVFSNLDFYRGKHVKNFYGIDSKIGCESYAYFDKYMITTASYLQLGLYYDLDEVELIPAPFQKGGYIFETSSEFNKVFISSSEYSVQLELKADAHYDGSGVGRIHKKNAPDGIALSTPFTGAPNYNIAGENEGPFSICPAVIKRKGIVNGADGNAKYTLVKKEKKGDKLLAHFKCELADKTKLLFSCSVDDDCVEIKVKAPFKRVGVCFPVFYFDGEKNTEISNGDREVSTKYGGYVCSYYANKIIPIGATYFNRNGEYLGYVATGKGRASLKIKIYKEEQKKL